MGKSSIEHPSPSPPFCGWLQDIHRTNLPLRLIHIDLIPQHHKQELLRIDRRRLDKELVSQALERLEPLGGVDIEDEDAAVGAEGLEAVLVCCVPELRSCDGGLKVRGGETEGG